MGRVDATERATSRKPRIAWLKSEHGLGTVTANFIAADAEGRSIVETYADEGALLDAMYAGKRPRYGLCTTSWPRQRTSSAATST